MTTESEKLDSIKEDMDAVLETIRIIRGDEYVEMLKAVFNVANTFALLSVLIDKMCEGATPKLLDRLVRDAVEDIATTVVNVYCKDTSVEDTVKLAKSFGADLTALLSRQLALQNAMRTS